MTLVNLSWPRWAELAAHLPVRTINRRGGAAWRIVHKAAALLANRYGRQQDARFALLAWEQNRQLRIRADYVCYALDHFKHRRRSS